MSKKREIKAMPRNIFLNLTMENDNKKKNTE